jgi:hypothetical protein
MPFGPSVLFTKSPTAMAPTKALRRAFSPFSSVVPSSKICVGLKDDCNTVSGACGVQRAWRTYHGVVSAKNKSPGCAREGIVVDRASRLKKEGGMGWVGWIGSFANDPSQSGTAVNKSSPPTFHGLFAMTAAKRRELGFTAHDSWQDGLWQLLPLLVLWRFGGLIHKQRQGFDQISWIARGSFVLCLCCNIIALHSPGGNVEI